MDYVNLGGSSLQVSRLCLGGNSWGSQGLRNWAALDAEASTPFFARALEQGINFFDTADTYNVGGSEEAMGRGLLKMTSRDDLVICTKVGMPASNKPNASGLGRKHVMASIDASLRRLGTDYVDIYMLHRYDAATPAEEIMSTLADIVRAGKVRYIGASSMRATQFARLQLFAKANNLPSFVAMQSLYNLLYREEEREMIPFCEEEKVSLIPYSPLARGVLSGTRRRDGSGTTERANQDKFAAGYYSDASFAIVDRVTAVAQKRNLKPSAIAMAWLLSKSAVAAPVVGVTKIEQIDEAVAALHIRLDATEIAVLEELYRPRPVQ